MKRLQNCAIVVVSLVISCTLGEVAVRWLRLTAPIEPGWGWHRSTLRDLQPPSASSEANELGVRGQSLSHGADDLVVLLVGDSQVEAAAVAMRDMPEAVLQRELASRTTRPVKVFSLAAAGWSQDQQLLAMRSYFEKRRADLVLVWATPSNDFWENTFPDRNTAKVAGPIKPTFFYQSGQLRGPYFEKPFYLFGSAAVQMLAQVILRKSASQIIVDRWLQTLPPALSGDTLTAQCPGTTEITLGDFFNNLSRIDTSLRYTMSIEEDFEEGRSHFAPQGASDAPRHVYERQLAKALFDELRNLAKRNGAQFKVFYPLRDDFDRRIPLVKCIRTSRNATYRHDVDNRKLLTETVGGDDLITFEVEGGDENIVGKGDRHFGVLGIQKTMKELAERIPLR